jgi:hypothetical protein
MTPRAGSEGQSLARRAPQASVGQDLRQAHELHELQELARRASEPHFAPVPASAELQPAERVHYHRVRLHAMDVAEDDAAGRLAKKGTDTVAQTGQVGARDRAANREADGSWRCCARCT